MAWATKPQRDYRTRRIELAAVLQKGTQHLRTSARRYGPRLDGALRPSKQQLQRERPRFALLVCEASECAELVPRAPQVEAHGAARNQIVFDLRTDFRYRHAAPPGQG